MAVNIDKEALIEDDEPLISVPKKKRAMYFWILYGLFTIDFIARIGINAIFPIIQGDLNLSDSQVGSLASIVLLGMSVFVLPISYIGEKKSPKKFITLSAFVWSIGSLLSGAANSFGVLVASRFMVGSGNAAYAPLSNSMITSMYKKSEWGKKIGIYNTAMTLGGALGAIIFANLANIWGWRAAFYVVGIISLILTGLSLLLPDTKKATDAVSSSGGKNQVNMKDAVKVTVKNKALMTMCLGAGIAIMGLQAVGAWTAIYFVRIMDMSIGQAAGLIGAGSLFAALGFPIGGMILDVWYKKDKRSRIWLPAICIAATGLCFIAGFYWQSIILILGAQVVYTFGGTCFHAASQELVPAWFKSISYGVYVIFIQFLGAMGPLVAGLLSESFGLVSALLMVQILFFVGAVVLMIAATFYLKDYNKARAAEQMAGCETCPE